MGTRKRMKDRYRRNSYLSDIEGMKNANGEIRGKFFPITEKGCAHRLGSFVVNLKLAPNRQRPDDIHAYCLHYQSEFF
jgi:hypothetical protein